MPVGHQRINAREQDPNPNITFIRALPEYPDQDQALHLMKSLAAQFKPIMKEWGFGVNSFVEYEWNPTFAGRNWNGGEIIEIVLRRRDGSFLPWNFILMVMAHECAHIKEMNHSHYFQKVNKQIRQALSTLRTKGYTGDGFYGRGRTLLPVYAGNDAKLPVDALPTYTCGGALKKVRRRRPRLANADGSVKPRRERGSAVQLGQTGRQTAVKKKAGGRVTKKLPGEGRVLGAKEGSEEDEEEGEVLSTKGLRTQSKASRAAREIAATSRLEAEKRAKAIEARLNGSGSGGGGANGAQSKSDDDGEDWEFEEEEEEDKPDIGKVEKRFGQQEKDYLRDEMRDWENDVEIEKEKEKEEGDGLTEKDKELMKKLKRKMGYKEPESEDDDVIIEEPKQASTSTSTSQKKKKAKVCLCKLPKWLKEGGKNEATIDEDDEEWIDEE